MAGLDVHLQLRHCKCISSVSELTLQLALAGVIGLAFKIIQRTPFHRAKDIDLQTDVEFFEELDIYYRQKRDEEGPGNLRQRIMEKMF